MATIKKHTAKNGNVTYYIRCYNGYDRNGKQIEHSMKWKPDDVMSERQIEKELNRQVVLFEEKIKRGDYFDGDTRFCEYAEKWLGMNKPALAPKTYERYLSLLSNVNMAIGEIRLCKLQSHHLQEFYNNLRESGIKKQGSYAVSKGFEDIISDAGYSKCSLAEKAGVSPSTLSTACKKGRKVSIDTAAKIADALEIRAEDIFEIQEETGAYSPKTILHHHRLISTILAQATRDRLVPFNVADKNYLKAPRVEKNEAVFLDDEQARKVLEKLEDEPLKWKTAMYLLIYSGMRRGELMGLEWADIDFRNKVIHIRNTSQYVRGMGIITKSPKTNSSSRTIKLADCVFELLLRYKSEWDKIRKALDDRWKYNIEITLSDGSKKIIHNDRLFIKDDSTPMNPDSLTDWVHNFVKRHNLPYFTPHSLRHTHATLLIAEGVNIPAVSKRLGHSSIATTTKVYVHAIQAADEIASEVIGDKLNIVKAKKAPKD